MTPGLALFYGGMVRSHNVLNVRMLSCACLAVVTVLWVLYGYDQLVRQAMATLATAAYSLVLTLLIAWAIHRVMGFRVHPEVEANGVDEAEHAEHGYDLCVHPTGHPGLSQSSLVAGNHR